MLPWTSPNRSGEYTCDRCKELIRSNAEKLDPEAIKGWARARMQYDTRGWYADFLLEGLCMALESRFVAWPRPLTSAQLEEMVLEATNQS